MSDIQKCVTLPWSVLGFRDATASNIELGESEILNVILERNHDHPSFTVSLLLLSLFEKFYIWMMVEFNFTLYTHIFETFISLYWLISIFLDKQNDLCFE